MSKRTPIPPSTETAEGEEPVNYMQVNEKLIGRSIVPGGTPIHPVFWWLRRRKRPVDS